MYTRRLSPITQRARFLPKEGGQTLTPSFQPGLSAVGMGTHQLSAVYALNLAREPDAIEAVYVDRNNRILEGTTTNLFMFQGEKLITPGQDILPGITRSVVLELAKDPFQIEIRDIDQN